LQDKNGFVKSTILEKVRCQNETNRFGPELRDRSKLPELIKKIESKLRNFTGSKPKTKKLVQNFSGSKQNGPNPKLSQIKKKQVQFSSWLAIQSFLFSSSQTLRLLVSHL
jgi:hypothetical protein